MWSGRFLVWTLRLKEKREGGREGEREGRKGGREGVRRHG